MTPAHSATAAERPGARPVWQLVLSFTIALMGFFLPFSTAGVAIAEVLLLLLVLFRPSSVARPQPWREPVMACGLLLLAYIAVHTLLVSGTGRESVQAINGYQELLVAPMLLALLERRRQREILFWTFVAGSLFLATLYWAALVQPWIHVEIIGERRISAGFAFVLCAYLLVLRAEHSPHAWALRGLAAVFVASVLFAIDARTGHVLLLVLAACVAWLHTPRRWRLPAAVGVPVVLLAIALASPAVRHRVNETLAGAQPLQANGEYTSTTTRIGLMRVAGALSLRYGLAGAGYANYGAVHAKMARELYPDLERSPRAAEALWLRSQNPHDEYVMQLVGGGVIALALFVAWLALAFRRGLRTAPPQGGMLLGLALAFAVGCTVNSLLLDFTEGHIYVALLAMVIAEARDRARPPRPIARVLVVCTRQIGDVLLTTPLLRAAHERWPQARIDVLAFAGTAGMLRGNPDVQTLLEFPARLGWPGLRSLVRRVWRRYDLALIADPGDRAHLIGWVAAPVRSGIVPARGRSNWLKRLALDHVVESAGDRGTLHVTAEKQSLLAPWQPTSALPRVVPPPAAPLPAALDAGVRPGAVVVHAPSMWPYKQWPIDHFKALVAGLLARGRQVLLTGSGSARDQECIASLRGLAPAPQLLDLSGQLDFNQLAGLLQRAALYIGPDTSVSHLAAATGVPVIAIFGPTNPQRWAPWPAQPGAQALFARSAAVQQVGNVTLLQGPQACVPCSRAGCEDRRDSRSDCLESITPAQVLAQVDRVLGGGAEAPAPSPRD
jgi:ADP-heptose:LPS heptosyltransferase/O-antigen ligase